MTNRMTVDDIKHVVWAHDLAWPDLKPFCYTMIDGKPEQYVIVDGRIVTVSSAMAAIQSYFNDLTKMFAGLVVSFENFGNTLREISAAFELAQLELDTEGGS